MIFTDKYTLEYDPHKDAHRVHSTEAPLCPSCGFLMSGYDNRRRKAIDSTGAVNGSWCGVCIAPSAKLTTPSSHGP